MPQDEIAAIAREIDKLCDLQTETLQPSRLKEISAAQLKEYEIRRDKIKELCANWKRL